MIEGKINPDNYVIMEALSDRYGWTPTQIRKQDVNDINSYLQIIAIKNLIEKHKMKKDGR